MMMLSPSQIARQAKWLVPLLMVVYAFIYGFYFPVQRYALHFLPALDCVLIRLIGAGVLAWSAFVIVRMGRPSLRIIVILA